MNALSGQTGAADDNSGTFPVQSERLFQALQGERSGEDVSGTEPNREVRFQRSVSPIPELSQLGGDDLNVPKLTS